MQHVIGEDRSQFQIIYLEQLVPENSWARVIDLFVDLLPLVELGFKHSILKNEGRPPYDPAMLLKLYLYGYKYSETIAIDSFKIFAQNSIRNNFTQKKIDRHLDYIDKKVEEYEAQLDESDAEDNKVMLREKIELKLKRRKK
ncbi:MAG: hypothetical protein ABFC18_06500 [Rikenellaceae bacterium]|jgi:hypothetical protein